MAMRKKVPVLAAGIVAFSAAGFSQDADSISGRIQDNTNLPGRLKTYAADKFAITRPLNIEFVYAAPYNFTPEVGEKKLPESKVTSFSQLKISTNFALLKRKNWLLGFTAGYRYTTGEADIIHPSTGAVKPVDRNFHYLFSSVNFTYFSTLFNKRMIYTSSLLVDGSDKHFERVKGLVTATMVLKANQRTRFAVGMLFNIDPSAQSLFVPTFSYEHKFNNGLIADIIFPKSFYLRKYVLTNGRLSLGAELDRTSFYLYNIDGTSQKYEYRQLDVNTGLTYEHVVARHFVVTAKTGIKLATSGRLFRKEDSFGDPVYEAKPDPTFYTNIGVSFNPFTIIGKKR